MKKYIALAYFLVLPFLLLPATLKAAGSFGPAPDFSLQGLNKNFTALNSYRDEQPVVLFFWTTWCPHCRKQLNNLDDLYTRMKEEGIEVLAVNTGESPVQVKSFLKGRTVDYKVLLDYDGRVANDYGLMGVPTYILINKKGNIVFKNHYFPDSEYKSLFSP